MSATNRGAERRENDFYETPRCAVDVVLPFLPLDPKLIVDPGAGTGAIAVALRERYPNADLICVERDADRAGVCRDRVYDTGAKVRAEGGWRVDLADFLAWAESTPDLIVGNPPYSQARDFVEHALGLAGPTGTVAMLLRLAWVAGQKRRGFHTENPSDLVVLSKRPSFCASFKCSCGARWTEPAGTRVSACPKPIGEVALRIHAELNKITRTDTDSADYAWFVWGPGPRGRVVVA